MKMKRLGAMLLTLLLAFPGMCLAASDDAADPLLVRGPARVRCGDHIEIVVELRGSVDGVYSEIQTQGLRFLEVSSGWCSEDGLVLVPGMGPSSATFYYEVTAESAETAAFCLVRPQASLNAESAACAERGWSCVASGPVPALPTPSVTSGECPVGPFAAPSAPNTDEPESALLHVSGPQAMRSGDVIAVSVSLSGRASASADVLTEGLSVLRTENDACSTSRILLQPIDGLDTAVYICRVSGAPGTQASFALSGTAESWTGTISELPVASKADAVLLEHVASGSSGGMLVVCRLRASSLGYTALEASSALVLPDSWDAEVRAGCGGRVRTAAERVATGDSVAFRNAECNVVLSGKVVVQGDLVGKGTIDVAQLVQMARLLRGEKPLSDVLLAAGDLNLNRRVDVADLAQLSRYLISS